jgi:hypothetical protein
MIGGESHLPYDRPPLSKDYLEPSEQQPAAPTFRTEQALREELDLDLRLNCPAVDDPAPRRDRARRWNGPAYIECSINEHGQVPTFASWLHRLPGCEWCQAARAHRAAGVI